MRFRNGKLLRSRVFLLRLIGITGTRYDSGAMIGIGCKQVRVLIVINHEQLVFARYTPIKTCVARPSGVVDWRMDLEILKETVVYCPGKFGLGKKFISVFNPALLTATPVVNLTKELHAGMMFPGNCWEQVPPQAMDTLWESKIGSNVPVKRIHQL